MKPTLDAIRDCLEGAIPAVMATCSGDGVPNVAYLSQVQFVDGEHVALSFQFFNKTRQNVLVNPIARLVVLHPQTAAAYQLTVRYLRTETAGPLFERMKAKLAGIASHTGMSGVFRLQGSDVYQVIDIQQLPGTTLPPVPPRRNLLSALRSASERLNACPDLDRLLNEALGCLASLFGIEHSMILMLDESGQRLYTVASHGYPQSGVGSEIALGHGVIGVAARERTPIRIGYMTSEYAYSRAIREQAAQGGLAAMLETEIPLPGLAESRSQLAVPIAGLQRISGVLFVESPHDLRFTYDDEDALVALAGQLGMSIPMLQNAAEVAEAAPGGEVRPPQAAGAPIVIRHYAENDSVFLDDDYLIKGVAGSIFWTLVSDFLSRNRSAFTNRELRLDPRIRLPDISDNLEARLILLQRRLAERDAGVHLEKTGRGRFRLCVGRPLQLAEVASGLPQR